MNKLRIDQLKDCIAAEDYALALDLIRDDPNQAINAKSAAEKIAVIADLLDCIGIHQLAEKLFSNLLRKQPHNLSALYRCCLSRYLDGDVEGTYQLGVSVPAENWYERGFAPLMIRAAIKTNRLPEAKRFVSIALQNRGTSQQSDVFSLAAQIAFWEDRDWTLLQELHLCEGKGTQSRFFWLVCISQALAGNKETAFDLISQFNRNGIADSNSYVGSSACAYEIYRLDGEHEKALIELNRIFHQQQMLPIQVSERTSSNFFQLLHCPLLNTQAKNDEVEKVSIVMTIHKFHVLAETAIKSILGQTYQNLELLIMIDGPADAGTQELTSRYAALDQRIIVVQLETNEGTYVAKNTGMRLSTGKYLSFMDCDDWSHPQRIERAVSLLECSTTDAIAVCDNSLRLLLDGTLFIRNLNITKDAPITLVIDRKEAINHVGFFDAVRCSADSEYLERIVAIKGRDSLIYSNDVTIFQSFGDSCLTGGGHFSYDWRGLVSDRFKYVQSFRSWHKYAKAFQHNMRIDPSNKNRKFYTPALLLSNKDHWIPCPKMERFQLDYASITKNICDLSGVPEIKSAPGIQKQTKITDASVVVLLCDYATPNLIAHSLMSLQFQSQDINHIILLCDVEVDELILTRFPECSVMNKSDLTSHFVEQQHAQVFICIPGYIYPYDYVSHFLTVAPEFTQSAVLGCESLTVASHSSETSSNSLYAAFFNSTEFAQKKNVPVNFLWIGSMMIHSSKLNLECLEAITQNDKGAAFAVHAQKQQWPLVKIQHRESWMQYIQQYNSESHTYYPNESAVIDTKFQQTVGQLNSWNIYTDNRNVSNG